MKKFRYYVTDLFDGCIKGTNNKETAENFATCEDYFVVDVETNSWIQPGCEVQIEEVMESEEG